MTRSSFIEFVVITSIFLFGIPVMFTLVVAVLLNSTIPPEIRIVQAGLIVAVTGTVLYGTVTYFLRRLHKEIEIAQMSGE